MDKSDLRQMSIEEIQEWKQEHDKFDRAREIDVFIDAYISARETVREQNKVISSLKEPDKVYPVHVMDINAGTVKAKVVEYLASVGAFGGDGVTSNEIVENVDANPSTIRSALSELARNPKHSDYFKYPDVNTYHLAERDVFDSDRGFGQYD